MESTCTMLRALIDTAFRCAASGPKNLVVYTKAQELEFGYYFEILIFFDFLTLDRIDPRQLAE